MNLQFRTYKRQINSKPDEENEMSAKSQAFLSTPNFVDDLTNICEEVLKSNDKIPFLKETLGKLN